MITRYNNEENSQAENDEDILLLNLADSDDEESSQDEPREVRIDLAPAPINTLTILHKFDRRDQLSVLNDRIRSINTWEKAKYALPASAAAFGITSLGAYAGFLIYFFTRPTLKQWSIASSAKYYMNAKMYYLNESCGKLFPLSADVCVNPLINSSIASYCGNLFGQVVSLQQKLNDAKFVMRNYPMPAVSVFDTLCGVPNLLAKCIDKVDPSMYSNSLHKMDVLANECIGYVDYIKSRYDWSQTNCNSTFWASAYSNMTPNAFMNTIPCGSLFPVFKDFCVRSSTVITDCFQWTQGNCSIVNDFSRNIAKFKNLSFVRNYQVFYPDLNSTLNQYNQTLIKYQNIINIPENITQMISEYHQDLNVTLPGVNYSCVDKFVSARVYQYCNDTAANICNFDSYDFYKNIIFSWSLNINEWTKLRILVMTGASLVMLVIFLGAIYTAIFGTTWLHQRTVVDDLSDQDWEELAEAFEILDLNHGEQIDGMRIDAASEILDNALNVIPDEKNLLTNIRHDFIRSLERIIPGGLPQELIQKIFYHAELFRTRPIDQHEMAERRYAFLMGREDENSTVPANLPDEIAYRIFQDAGLPTRFSQEFVPDTTTMTNRHLKENCFAFLLGRDDESSVIPEITTKEIFQRIYSHAGLFKRQLSVGKYELISNEKLSKLELESKRKQIEAIACKYRKPNDGIVEWQLPVYYTKLKENCFTFFTGRDDKSSHIPEITPKEVFQRINAYAGLLK